MEAIFVTDDYNKYVKIKDNTLYHIVDMEQFFFNCKNQNNYDYLISSTGKWDDKENKLQAIYIFDKDKLSYKDALYYYTIAKNNEFYYNRMKKKIHEKIKLLSNT